MITEIFDPREFINREFEQVLFEELLRLQDESRILAVKDLGGMGKSHLLRRFQYRCRTVEPRTPVSLVALDHLSDGSPFALAQTIVQDLKRFSLEFPTFDYFEGGRKAHDFTVIRGQVDLRGANTSHGKHRIAGVMTNIDQPSIAISVTGSTPTLTPDQEREAQKVSLRAFLKDLSDFCRLQTVVIMLDAYEKCEPALQNWITGHLLEHYCFNIEKRPKRLLLVIAGRELPDFELFWPPKTCEAVIKSVNAMSKWTATHVADLLRILGYKFTQREIDTFFQMTQIGLSPSHVIESAEFVLGGKVEQA